MKTFDVAILGGGPGGTRAAQILAKAGKKIALISDELGGECLNYGCIPTKTYLASAELLQKSAENASGFIADRARIDWNALKEYRAKIVSKLQKKLEWSVTQSGALIIKGRGILAADGHSITVGTETISASHVILAMGSEPRKIENFSKIANLLTSRDIISIPEIPKTLLIIGGGAIGVEFASFFQTLGTKVTIKEHSQRILLQEDIEVSSELARVFERKGITVQTNTQAKPEDCSNFDYALMAIGRMPSCDRGIAEKIGIEISDRGIATNENMQTTVPHIFAIGDVAGKAYLAYTAEREGEIAAFHILGRPTDLLDYSTVPNTIFSLPEVASVGLNEEKIKEKRIEFVSAKSLFSANAKALILGSRDGFAKIYAEKQSGRILGVHLIGEKVTELIGECSLAVTLKLTASQWRKNLHSHPVLSEVIKEACDELYFANFS